MPPTEDFDNLRHMGKCVFLNDLLFKSGMSERNISLRSAKRAYLLPILTLFVQDVTNIFHRRCI